MQRCENQKIVYKSVRIKYLYYIKSMFPTARKEI